jgi:Domain of unknown function (DUF4954)
MGILLTDHLVTRVRATTAHSEFLRATRSAHQDGGLRLALGDSRVRQLSPVEIERLERQGNSAADWSKVLVAEGFDPTRVRNSDFHGEVILGRFVGSMCLESGLEFPTGIYNSTLVGCIIGHDTLVKGVRLLGNYVVGPGAVVLDCGRVTCDSSSTFGNGIVLPLGPETGDRPVRIYAEMDVETAAAIAQPGGQPPGLTRDEQEAWKRPVGRGLLDSYAAAVADYTALAACGRGIVERGAQVLATPRIRNTYIGPAAVVDGATLLADCTLLSSEEEVTRVQSGVCVTNSLLQWGSSVTMLAIVDRSLLTEHSHVERHAKVTNSVLGPNTSVGAGEVTSCLLGPFVAAHHQSLLIATLWPAGKGNVGYGANVGSNHTSRAPDQEFWSGEGMFLGLGVNVKFPADFSRAPFTVVACGATLLPQKCLFPFSLIATPSTQYPGLSLACMEIFPAWVLGENLYGLRRNEAKFRSRNKARRSHFEFSALRPETIDLMRGACRRLQEISQTKDVYTEADIKGLGKNFVTEVSRIQALQTYRFFIGYYALLGLVERVRGPLTLGDADACAALLTAPSEEPRWEHQRQILVNELGIWEVPAGLKQFSPMLEKAAQNVEVSKARDDRRGVRVIDDYLEAHISAAKDECVRQTWEETRRLQAEVEDLLLRWHALVGTGSDDRNGRSNWGSRPGGEYFPGPEVIPLSMLGPKAAVG